VDIARRLEVPKMMLLVNKALSSFDFDALKLEVESTYNAPVAAILPLTEEMIQLGSSDIFCLRFPNHPLTQIYSGVAGMLMV
jgi:MinD-like ATPase involved in chromosome partitioning or flagellar assembly